MEPTLPRPQHSLGRWLFAAHGFYMVLSGLGLAFFCWLIPRRMVIFVESDILQEAEIPALAGWVIANRDFMPLLALPVVVLGVVVIRKVRPTWLWVAIGLVAMLLPALLMLYTFIATLGLLYEYRELA